MHSPTSHILIVMLLLLIAPDYLWAQEDTDDYRLYKFYKEEDDVLSWFEDDVDSIALETSLSSVHRSRSYYSLRALNFSSRGESRYSESYVFEGVDVDPTISRLLSHLGTRSSIDASHITSSSINCRTTSYHVHDTYPNVGHHRIGASLSGRSHLLSLSHSACYGLSRTDVALDDDWHLAEYVRLNTGPDLYVDGLFSNGLEAGVAMSRQWRNNSLYLSAMLPWTRRSVRVATTEEAYRLTGNHGYNPAWGFQNGKLRSSRINSTLAPTIVASWQRKLGLWTTMCLTTHIQFERGGRSALAWCNAMTPMPDNYRYMPSYFTDDDDRRLVEEEWRYGNQRYTQIDWNGLYHTNSIQSDGHAVYLVENKRTNAFNSSANVGFTTLFRGVVFYYGLRLDALSTRHFKIAEDLLGADYLLDVDYFIRDDDTYGTKYRNNLRNTNLHVAEGGRYGYDYRLTKIATMAYGVARWTMWDMDFELGANVSTAMMRRRGYFEKELFAGSRSLGASRSITLFPASIFASWHHTIGYHDLDARLMFSGSSPDTRRLYLQADYNNRQIDNPHLSKKLSGEFTYHLSLMRLSLRASAYVSYSYDDVDVLHYYDDVASEYVDAVVNDISRLSYGLEVNAEIRWSQYFSSEAAINIGRNRYAKDAVVRTYADNDNDLIAVSRSSMRGVNSSLPELAAYADISFRRAGWNAQLSCSYVGLRYVTPSFVRRTERIYTYAQSPEEQLALLSQQSLGGAVSLNLSLARSFRFSGGRWLSVRLTADNLLGANNIGSGYEQNRIRKVVISQREHVRPFANKVTLGYGRTCRINVSFGF